MVHDALHGQRGLAREGIVEVGELTGTFYPVMVQCSLG